MELKVNEIQVPEKIEFNFEELKAELMQKTELYATVVYTDDQIKQAKADRANLNKLKKAINDERIRREREYMKPFTEFKAQIAEILGIIDKPIAVIDRQIKEAEEKEQTEKKAKIEELFGGLPNKPEWLTLAQIWDARWMNKGTTFRMIEENMVGWCGRIETEMKTLEGLTECAFEAIEEYKRTLDLGKAVETGRRMAEVQRMKEEEAKRKAVEEDRDFPTQEDIDETNALLAEVRSPEIADDDIPLPSSWIKFEALLTIDTAAKLKMFCAENGIEIRAI